MRSLFPLLFLAGCMTEGAFITPISRTYCDRFQECDKGEFEGDYSSQADCIDDTRKPWDDFRKCAMDAGCTYRPDEARQCDLDLATMSCEDFVSPEWRSSCDQIYDCSPLDEDAIELCKFDKHHWP